MKMSELNSVLDWFDAVEPFRVFNGKWSIHSRTNQLRWGMYEGKWGYSDSMLRDPIYKDGLVIVRIKNGVMVLVADMEEMNSGT